MAITWSPLATHPTPCDVSEAEWGLMIWLADVRYASTGQVAQWLEMTDRAAGYHVRKLSQAGYLQSTYWHNGRQRYHVWTVSRHGGTLLAATDERWRDQHDQWLSVPDQGVKGKSVLHALDRNQVVLDMLVNADQLRWHAAWNLPTRRYVEPVSGARLVPDALVTVHGHLWLIEMERSWRGSTLQDKITQYDAFYSNRGWGRYMRVLPRVLLVASSSSTQERNLDTWLDQFDSYRFPWMAVLPWSELQDQWRCWVWPRTGPRQLVGWVDLHNAAKTPIQPPPQPTAARRLRVRHRDSDTPWLD